MIMKLLSVLGFLLVLVGFDKQMVNASPESCEGITPDLMEPSYSEDILGLWDVKYTGEDGMIRQDNVERLVMMQEGTFTWTPTPGWARSKGHWRVTKIPDLNDALALCFEQQSGGLVVPLLGHDKVTKHAYLLELAV
ncbi:MAG: hypothetical protein ACT4O4_00960 [Nitrospiraceae bacterium]